MFERASAMTFRGWRSHGTHHFFMETQRHMSSLTVNVKPGIASSTDSPLQGRPRRRGAQKSRRRTPHIVPTLSSIIHPNELLVACIVATAKQAMGRVRTVMWCFTGNVVCTSSAAPGATFVVYKQCDPVRTTTLPKTVPNP